MPEKCPQCGAPLPAGALAGLCPACLLQQGAAADTATGAEAGVFVPPSVEEVARHFPGLEILELLGRGGMGAVYKARQKQLDRLVALKILPPRSGDDSAFAERFTREAKALARLNHPGIVTLYEFGKADSQLSTLNPQPPLYYFLMEFVDGVNLRQLLAGSRIAPREALAIVPQICDALQYAHDQGIVHRDIKPDNILLDRRGRVKVADFGLAKIVEGGDTSPRRPGDDARTAGPAVPTALTEAGKIMGTPKYMSPEQIEAPGQVDHRADIYALGVVFYQMLTGELPGKPLEPPSSKVHIDVRLDEVVLRALERKPELRYQQASILKTQVETIALTPAAAAPPAATIPGTYRGVDYRSKATLFGLPWLHVASGIDPATGKQRVAKGIIAIGGMAKGVVAIGGVAVGGLAIGGVATGGLAMGGLCIGVFPFGGLALGLLASGGLAAGLVAAFGGLAIAPIALGGLAIGYLAYGGAAFGAHAWSSLGHDPVADAFFGSWAQGFIRRANVIMMMLVAVVVVASAIVPAWLQSRLAPADASAGPASGPTVNGVQPKEDRFWRRYGIAVAVALLLLVTIVVGASLLAHALPKISRAVRQGSSGRAEKPAFGPVIERVLLDPDNGDGRSNHETLNLHGGALASVLHGAKADGGGRIRSLLAGAGDLYAEYDDYVGRRWALITHGLKLSDLTPSQWERATVSDLNRALEVPTAVDHVDQIGATLYLLPDGLQPMTFAFQTREGVRGLMQVTGFADNPRGVKLRYKLVQAPTDSAALKPIPPKAAELAAAWMVYAKAYGESQALTDTNVQVTFGKVAGARLKEVEDLLKGTVAEPLVKQQREALAELRKASQAKDMEKVRANQKQIMAIDTQLEKMLGLGDGASGSVSPQVPNVAAPR